MARPKNKSELQAISVSLPSETHEYLVLLATLGKFGASEQEVAAYILTREVEALIERKFHDKRF